MQTDIRMLSLAPQGSEIIVGISPGPRTHAAREFVLFTFASRIDYEDFVALAAADPALRIDRLMFTAAAGASKESAEHSVIVSGHFDADRIHRSLSVNALGTLEYRGVPASVVRPLERERSYFWQERILAIVGTDLAIFGTPNSVREEIDRLLDGAVADSLIARRLRELRHKNDSWYLVRSAVQRAEFAKLFRSLNSF
jgi:hypothetical protein